ncbi:hypothetical protein ACFVIM_03955 [Streptomyces sp. NPDC057638]|uniref:hypothetical protein n=1 Tax=Streptomyces sp. NPDC057638 TaxID=3346190 RepID=UPI0036CA9153
MSATAVTAQSGRGLIAPPFFERLSRRLTRKGGLSIEQAEAITDQALAFLATCAQRPPSSATLSPSPLVDLGWHVFLEYTAEYDAFFARHGWRKVQHAPFDDPTATYEAPEVVIPRTLDAMERAGYAVNGPLWVTSTVDCGGDDSDDVPGDPLPCGDHP